MRNIWVISDTHFNHENIIKYCNRPFANAKEMNEAMIDNWNSTVKDGDIVYHCGDVYFGKNTDWSHRLNGRKRLILGNHDNAKDQTLQNMFEKIMVWRMFPEFGLLLTHVPVHKSSLEVKVFRNVHGHTHDVEFDEQIELAGKRRFRYTNVCVEKIGYKPINIEDLRVK